MPHNWYQKLKEKDVCTVYQMNDKQIIGQKEKIRSHVSMTCQLTVSLTIMLVPHCSSLVSIGSWRVVCIKATVMYHCLTLLPQSPCPLTFNLILTFPHTLGSCPLSTIVTPLTVTWKGNRVPATGGWQFHLLAFICLACLVTVKSYCERVFFSVFSFFFQWSSTHHLEHTVRCSSLLIHRAHTIHFKECEEWVQKSNLTKGCHDSMGEALLCKGLMVCSERGLYISAF